jgi:hypothetical protein
MNSSSTSFLHDLILTSKSKRGRIALISIALIVSVSLIPFAFAGIYLFIKSLNYSSNPTSGWNLQIWGLLGSGALLGLAGIWIKLIVADSKFVSNKLLKLTTIVLLTIGILTSAAMSFWALKEPALMLLTILVVALTLGVFLLVSIINISSITLRVD